MDAPAAARAAHVVTRNISSDEVHCSCSPVADGQGLELDALGGTLVPGGDHGGDPYIVVLNRGNDSVPGAYLDVDNILNHEPFTAANKAWAQRIVDHIEG